MRDCLYVVLSLDSSYLYPQRTIHNPPVLRAIHVKRELGHFVESFFISARRRQPRLRLRCRRRSSSHHHIAAVHHSPNPPAASTANTGPHHLAATIFAPSHFTALFLSLKLPESLILGKLTPTGTSTPRNSQSGPHPCSTLYSRRRSGGTRARASSCRRRYCSIQRRLPSGFCHSSGGQLTKDSRTRRKKSV